MDDADEERSVRVFWVWSAAATSGAGAATVYRLMLARRYHPDVQREGDSTAT